MSPHPMAGVRTLPKACGTPRPLGVAAGSSGRGLKDGCLALGMQCLTLWACQLQTFYSHVPCFIKKFKCGNCLQSKVFCIQRPALLVAEK